MKGTNCPFCGGDNSGSGWGKVTCVYCKKQFTANAPKEIETVYQQIVGQKSDHTNAVILREMAQELRQLNYKDLAGQYEREAVERDRRALYRQANYAMEQGSAVHLTIAVQKLEILASQENKYQPLLDQARQALRQQQEKEESDQRKLDRLLAGVFLSVGILLIGFAVLLFFYCCTETSLGKEIVKVPQQFLWFNYETSETIYNYVFFSEIYPVQFYTVISLFTLQLLLCFAKFGKGEHWNITALLSLLCWVVAVVIIVVSFLMLPFTGSLNDDAVFQVAVALLAVLAADLLPLFF
jgi:hypothetical protein